MATEGDDLIRVGVVTGTHGLKGDLKVRPFSEGSSSLLGAEEVFLAKPEETALSHVPVRSVAHKGNILLRLQGLEDVNAVQHLVGCEVFVRYRDLEELPEGDFYWFEIEGLSVVDRQRGEIGTLESLMTTAAHDIYVVQGPFGEVLIPAVSEFIVEVDLEGRCMKVDLPEGLVPEPDEV